MVWPLRYSTIVEHGKCARGSSSDLCGAYAVGLDAIVSSKDVDNPDSLLGCAGFADRFDAANLECGTRPILACNPLDGYLMSHVFGEAFRWEAIRRQICDDRHCLVVDKHPLPLLFVHAPRQRCRLTLRFRLLLGLCFRLLIL